MARLLKGSRRCCFHKFFRQHHPGLIYIGGDLVERALAPKDDRAKILRRCVMSRGWHVQFCTRDNAQVLREVFCACSGGNWKCVRIVRHPEMLT